MTDREMLELAAKANGHRFPWFFALEARMHEWNPLTDDGDALRLAVKLRIPTLYPGYQDITVAWGLPNADCIEEPHAQDPYAATRRAITRAAAEIGKAMK